MNHLADIFFHSSHAPYLLGSYGAVLLVLVSNVLLSLSSGRRLKREIRRELEQRRAQP